jgi:16S rRNA (guanine527-N7)-methyltransferase
VQQVLLESEAGVTAQQVGEHARELGLDLSAAQCEQLELFARLLSRWNRTHNLTAITRGEQVLTHHLLDRLSAAGELSVEPSGRILDAGAGAGLPGLPLAVALRGRQFTLVDAVDKKCAFMIQATLELGLSNVQVVHARLEGKHPLRDGAHPRQFDVILARALGSLATLVSLTADLLAAGGRWVAMKGHVPEDELKQLPPGISVSRIAPVRVPRLGQARHLVVLQPTHLAR